MHKNKHHFVTKNMGCFGRFLLFHFLNFAGLKGTKNLMFIGHKKLKLAFSEKRPYLALKTEVFKNKTLLLGASYKGPVN